MNVPTMQLVNAMGCCCPWPLCPGPRFERQLRSRNLAKNLLIPLEQPMGDSSDPMPMLYDQIDWTIPMYEISGEWVVYQGWRKNPTGPGWAESLHTWAVATAGAGGAITYSGEYTGNFSPATSPPPFSPVLVIPPVPLSSTTGTYVPFIYSASGGSADSYVGPETETEIEAEDYEVTDTKWTWHYAVRRQQSTDIDHAPSLQGSGGEEDFKIEAYKDIIIKDGMEFEISMPWTKSTFFDDAKTGLEGVGWGSVGTVRPKAGTIYTWPKIGDHGPWPDNDAYWLNYPLGPGDKLTASAILTGCRYKVGIPLAWHTANNAWSIWNALTDEEKAELPEPKDKRSTFSLQWDEIFEPKKWLDYKSAYRDWEDDHDAWQVTHGEWENEPEDERGDEPEEPVAPGKPTAPEDRPQLIQHRSWNYGGPGSDPFSDYFEMGLAPETGEVSVYNMLVKCYKYADVGLIPTSDGPVLDLSDP